MVRTKKNLNVGLIGLGRLGRKYADYLAHRVSRATLIAVCDIKEEIVEHLAELYGAAKYLNYQDLIAAKEVDAVVIVTPTNTHKHITIESAKLGKPIFCEKPLCLSLEEAAAVQQMVDQTGVFFHLGFMRRFDRGYSEARKKIENGDIGKPIVFKSTSRDPQRASLDFLDPKHSGGIFLDMGIHDFDLALWIMGGVKSVFSIGGRLAYPEMQKIDEIDNAITNLRFTNGGIGVVDMSRNAVYGYDIHTEILGTKGALRIGYLRETPLQVLAKENIGHDAVPGFLERFGNAYVAQLQDFVDKVLMSQPPSVTCQDGISALNIGLAATRSFKQNLIVDII